MSAPGETTAPNAWVTPPSMRVGDVVVYPIMDGLMPVPPAVLYPDVALHFWRTTPAGLVDDRLEVPYGAFLVVDANGNRVLVDAGGGPTPNLLPDGSLPRWFGQLPGALRAAGTSADQINHVVITHAHADHVGWVSLEGAPYFTNATHHMHDLEWASIQSGTEGTVKESVWPISGQLELWSGDQATPLPWLHLHHAPGHSPGNTVVVIESGSDGQKLAIVGDVFHHPVGVSEPQWRCGFDEDHEAAARQRVKWAQRFRAEGTPIVSTHFPEMTPLATY